jgi:hypothetical protein
MEAYARQIKDRQLMIWATEIHLRAERRAGQLLRDMAARGERVRRGGDRRSKSSRHEFDRPTLGRLGISPDQSSVWQQLATISEAEFERRLGQGDRASHTAESIIRDGRRPSFDLRGRHPEDFKAATHGHGALRECAETAAEIDPSAMVRGAFVRERREMAEFIQRIRAWFDLIEHALRRSSDEAE